MTIPDSRDKAFNLDALFAAYDAWVDPAEMAPPRDVPPDSFVALDRERRELYATLSDEEKAHYRDRAEYFLNLLDAKDVFGRQLPRGMIREAMHDTGWSRRTIQRRMQSFAAYLQRNLRSQQTDAQRIEIGAPFFIALPPGREKGQNALPEELKKIIVYAVLFRTRITVTRQNKYRREEIDFSYLDVYRFAKAVFMNTQTNDQETAAASQDETATSDTTEEEADSEAAELQPIADEHPDEQGPHGEEDGDQELPVLAAPPAPRILERFPSYDTVRRFIHYLMEKIPALFVYGTLGRREVEEKIILKRANNVAAPNIRWQSDVIGLRLYVRHNGQVCLVSLLIIYDDYSRYIVWWTLFVREVVVDPKTGKSKKTAVDTCTVSTAFATAMYVSRARCWVFYTDRGSYYERSEEGFYALTADDEPEVAVSNTGRGRPEGRGKVENVLGKTKQGLVARFPSRYNKRSEIKQAQQKAITEDVQYEEVYAEFEDHFAGVNQKPFRKNGKRSRFEIWTSVASLPAPPIRKLAQLPDIVSYDNTVNIRNNWVVSLLGGEWEPRETNAAVYRRWADGVARKAAVRVIAVRLDIGWVAEVCLDAEHDAWLEIVPKAAIPTDTTAHNAAQHGALEQMEAEIAALGVQAATILQQQGGTPIMRVASGEYESQCPDAEALVKETKRRRSTSTTQQRKRGGTRGTKRTAGGKKHRQAGAPAPPPGQSSPSTAAITAEEDEEVSFAAIWAAQKAKRNEEDH